MVTLEAVGISTATYSADTAMGDATVDVLDNDEDFNFDEGLEVHWIPLPLFHLMGNHYLFSMTVKLLVGAIIMSMS